MSKTKNVRFMVLVSILLLTIAVPMIPKVSSGGAPAANINYGWPAVTAWNDALGPFPQGYLINLVPPAPPAGLVPGFVTWAPPWPWVNGPFPAVPPPPPPAAGIPPGWALFQWTNLGGPLQPGPNIDILFPVVVWTAAGVKFTLAKMMWNGVSLGRSIGQVVNLDLDADGSIETYWRFYVDPVDPGEVNLFYEEAGAVGGFVVSVDKFGLLAPYIGLASTILVATVANSHLRQAC